MRLVRVGCTEPAQNRSKRNRVVGVDLYVVPPGVLEPAAARDDEAARDLQTCQSDREVADFLSPCDVKQKPRHAFRDSARSLGGCP